MIYIICFILSPLFAYFSQKQFKNNKKYLGIFFLFICILLPSLVAGLRGLGVGRDIKAYVIPAISNAKSLDFMTYFFKYDIEIGYKLLIYLCTLISSNVHFALFILQFLTILFVSLFAYKIRKNVDMHLIILIYMLTWFCQSLTFMRQSISIAIILYSIPFFWENKKVKTLILFLLAVSFHKTAILSLVIYGFIALFKSKINIKKKKLIYLIFIFGMIMGTLFFKDIVYFLSISLKIFPERYYLYIKYYLATPESKHWAGIIYSLSWLVLAFYYKFKVNVKTKKTDCFNIDVIICCFIINVATGFLSHIVINLDRIGLYFFYPALILFIPKFSNIVKKFKKIFKSKKIITLMSYSIYVYLFTFWLWQFVLHNWCETLPYYSDVITFLH